MNNADEQHPASEENDDNTQPISSDDDFNQEKSGEDETDLQEPVTEEEFILLRLTFDQHNFILEKGALQEGDIRYSQLAAGDLSRDFTPALLNNEDETAGFIDEINQAVKEWTHEDIRIAIVLPDNWGFVKEITASKNLPEDELIAHIAWSLQLSGWEDKEKARFNFKFLTDDNVLVAAVRERVFKFAESIAQSLSGKLVQLSLKDVSQINLIPEVQPEIEDVEFPFQKEGRPKALLLIPFLIIIIAGIAYYLFGIKKIDIAGGLPFLDKGKRQISQDIADSSAAEAIVQAVDSSITSGQESFAAADSTSIPPAQSDDVYKARIEGGPFSGLLSILNEKSKISYLSITEGTVRCELSASSFTKLNNAVNEINRSRFAGSAEIIQKEVVGNRYNGIIVAQIANETLDAFRHPDETSVLSLFVNEGFSFEDNILIGDMEEITSALSLIDNNRILFYRISLVGFGSNKYKLKMEY
ncbi:MAG: hypothetical protein HQ591_05750 [candidate division Zixibacteria bacterium]|nr:hypothetical protein [Candidatus Tariuqbacter arcticus]